MLKLSYKGREELKCKELARVVERKIQRIFISFSKSEIKAKRILEIISPQKKKEKKKFRHI